ncbi:translation initiation factor 2 [Cellulomonas hominis]
MTTPNQPDPSGPAQSLAEASRAATAELHKQGTPEYDARAHQRAVERERRVADAVRDEDGSSGSGE